MNKLLSRPHDLLIIIALFFLGRGLMLFNDGVFWDDWTFFLVDDRLVFQQLLEAGCPLRGIIFVLLNHHPLLSRFITFFAFLVSGILLYKILKTIKEITPTDQLYLVLFLLLFPLNRAMITMTLTSHMLFHLSFYVGAFFLNLYILQKKPLHRIASLICFFLSFQTESFLVFYLVPFSLIFYHEKPFPGFPVLWKKLKRYWAFAMLPVFYWILKQSFFKPYGSSSGYNAICLPLLYKSPLNVIDSSYSSLFLSFIHIFHADEGMVEPYYFYCVFTVLVVLLYLSMKNRSDDEESRQPLFKLFIFGLFAYVCSVFAYMAVRDMHFDFGNGWTCRYQIHISLAGAIILYFFFKWFVRECHFHKNVLSLLLSVILAGFILSDIMNCAYFQRDWFKRLALVEKMKNNPDVVHHTTFIMADMNPELDAISEKYRNRSLDYELSGVLNYAFNDDEKRMAIRSGTFETMQEEIQDPVFANKSHYIPDRDVYVIEYAATKKWHFKKIYSTILYRLFDQKRYKEYLDSFLTMDVYPVGSRK